MVLSFECRFDGALAIPKAYQAGAFLTTPTTNCNAVPVFQKGSFYAIRKLKHLFTTS